MLDDLIHATGAESLDYREDRVLRRTRNGIREKITWT